jgi:transglutaminase/protease-like cytokinesis protein 3
MNIKTTVFSGLVFCLLSVNLFSQEVNYEKIERYIDSISIDVSYESFENLAKALVRPNWAEIEKAYGVYYWITSNITYDSIGFANNKWARYSDVYKIAYDTYKLRKGVCVGYSYLFKFMCDEIGVKAKVINGYSRTETYEAGMPVENSNHAWNAIYVDNKWGLVDATWGKILSINKRYYFLTPPDEFILLHFPEKPEEQFTKRNTVKADFDRYPFISSLCFEIGYCKDYPKNGLIIANKNSAEISVPNPDNMLLVLRIFDYSEDKWKTQDYTTTYLNKQTTFKISLKKKGRFLAELTAIQQYDPMEMKPTSIYRSLMAFTIINK